MTGAHQTDGHLDVPNQASVELEQPVVKLLTLRQRHELHLHPRNEPRPASRATPVLAMTCNPLLKVLTLTDCVISRASTPATHGLQPHLEAVMADVVQALGVRQIHFGPQQQHLHSTAEVTSCGACPEAHRISPASRCLA